MAGNLCNEMKAGAVTNPLSEADTVKTFPQIHQKALILTFSDLFHTHTHVLARRPATASHLSDE